MMVNIKPIATGAILAILSLTSAELNLNLNFAKIIHFITKLVQWIGAIITPLSPAPQVNTFIQHLHI
jgi:hypothetical protein